MFMVQGRNVAIPRLDILMIIRSISDHRGDMRVVFNSVRCMRDIE